MNPKLIIPAGAPKAVGLAADEFAKYWKLVTGRDWAEESDAVAYFKVDSALDTAHDEYLIRSVADGVEFTGSNGRERYVERKLIEDAGF